MLLLQSKKSQAARHFNGLFNSPQKKFVIFSLVLFAATLLLFNPLSECKFLNYDDNDYITENAHVQS